jgi:hypothetical protein
LTVTRRRGLEQNPKLEELPPLPACDCGPFLVDVSDRDALFDVFDEERYEAWHEVRDKG